MIVAIEGIDASGKATLTSALVEYFKTGSQFTQVESHDFPHYQTEAAGVAGRVIRGEVAIIGSHLVDDDLLDRQRDWTHEKAVIIQSLLVCDRLEWQHLLVPFAEDPNTLLVLDRYWHSGIVYGQADGVSRSYLKTIQQTLIEPDLELLLDITVEESIKRRPQRRDYYEKNFEKLRKVRDIYINEFTDEDAYHRLIIDAKQTPDIVLSAAVRVIEQRREKLLDKNLMAGLLHQPNRS